MAISPAQAISKLNDKIKQLESDRPLLLAVRAANEARIKRIFEDGKGTDGANIGTYNSTTPVYIDPNDAPRRGNQVGKRGKPIKSLYYDSYKAFRAAMGRESNFVNLRLNNELQSDLANAQLSKSSNTLAKSNPIKVTSTKYKVTLKKQINIDKVDGLTARFGSFINHTKEEIDIFNKVYNFEINKILNK